MWWPLLAAGGCLALGIWALMQHKISREAVRAAARLTTEQEEKATAQPIPSWMQQAMRASLPLAERLTTEDEKKRLALLLDQAGHPYRMYLDDFLGFRVLGALCGGLFGGWFSSMWMILVGLAGGYYGATWWLKSIVNGREAQIRKDLPDYLDAVAISLQAGVPIDHALRLVADHFTGPLKDEFTKLLDETALGLPRGLALRHLQERTPCKEMEMLAVALAHGLQLGVPLADTFAAQARALRSTRAQRARQLAGQATPKITLVSTLLVTPVVLGLIIGIIILNLMLNPDMMGFRSLIE